MLLVAIGGLAASGGVLLGWWEARAVRTTEIFGREILEEVTLAGWSSWGGALALGSGAMAVIVGLAGLAGGNPERRRWVLPFAALAAGLLAAVGAALGLAQGGEAAARALGGAGREVEASVAGGLVISGLGGLLVAAGGLLARTAAGAEGARSSGPASVP
jgi:hypothetical protein